SEGLSVDGHVDPHEKTLRLMLKIVRNVIPTDSNLQLTIPTDTPVTITTQDTPKTKKFRIRLREGMSIGPIVKLRFDIWDYVDDLSAESTFKGLAASAGIPASLTDAGDFTYFRVPDELSVNGFESPAKFNSTGGLTTSFSELVLLMPPI